MLAHAHLSLLLEAIGIAESAASAISGSGGLSSEEQAEKLVNALSPRWASNSVPMPEPAGCHSPYCLSTSAQCFSTYTPRSPDADLAALAVGPALGVDLDINHDGKGGASSSGKLSTWVVALPPGMDLEHHASFGYLDFKLALRGDKSSGVLNLAFTATLKDGAGSPVVVCQPQCPWGKCKANQRLLHDSRSVKFSLDGKALVPPDPKTMPIHDQAFDKEGVCIVVGYAQKGKHKLSVEVLGGIIFISHLLFF